jgi:hypothetical protein
MTRDYAKLLEFMLLCLPINCLDCVDVNAEAP